MKESSVSPGGENSRRRFLKQATAVATTPVVASLVSCAGCKPGRVTNRIAPQFAFPKGIIPGTEGAVGPAGGAKLVPPLAASDDPPNASSHPDPLARQRALAEWSLERLIHDVKKVLQTGVPENGGKPIDFGGNTNQADAYVNEQKAFLKNGKPLLLGARAAVTYLSQTDGNGVSHIVGLIVEGCVLLKRKRMPPHDSFPIKYDDCEEARAAWLADQSNAEQSKFRRSDGGAHNHLVYSSSSSSSYWGLP